MTTILRDAQAILSLTADRWQQLTQHVADERLLQQPRAGEWSAAECLQHLVDTERYVFPVRVRAILAGGNFPDFDPDADGTVRMTASPRELAAEFAAMRTESLALLATLSEDDLARTGEHAALGIVTMAQLLHEWAGHELMHLVQAEQSLMQPFIAGSGPWRHYFAAHDTNKA
jgi:hypothetical protein